MSSPTRDAEVPRLLTEPAFVRAQNVGGSEFTVKEFSDFLATAGLDLIDPSTEQVNMGFYDQRQQRERYWIRDPVGLSDLTSFGMSDPRGNVFTDDPFSQIDPSRTEFPKQGFGRIEIFEEICPWSIRIDRDFIIQRPGLVRSSKLVPDLDSSSQTFEKPIDLIRRDETTILDFLHRGPVRRGFVEGCSTAR